MFGLFQTRQAEEDLRKERERMRSIELLYLHQEARRLIDAAVKIIEATMRIIPKRWPAHDDLSEACKLLSKHGSRNDSATRR